MHGRRHGPCVVAGPTAKFCERLNEAQVLSSHGCSLSMTRTGFFVVVLSKWPRKAFINASRDQVWKHLDLVAPKETKCKKCGSCLAYAASTSTMLHHLRAVHGIDMSGSSTPASQKTGIDAFVVSSPRAAPCSAAKSAQVTDLLVDWCVTDMRPLSIVSDAGLKRIFPCFL